VGYYAAFRRKGILTLAATCRSLENLVLSAMSQVQQGKHCRISLLQGSWRSQIHRARKQNSGCQGLEKGAGGNGELVLNGYIKYIKFSFAR